MSELSIEAGMYAYLAQAADREPSALQIMSVRATGRYPGESVEVIYALLPGTGLETLRLFAQVTEEQARLIRAMCKRLGGKHAAT